MRADACIVYYGLRYDVRQDEVEALEARKDGRVIAARRVGLKHWWGNSEIPERHFLVIGTELGNMGLEGQLRVEVTTPALRDIMLATAAKLREAGGEPTLIMQCEPDY